MDPLDYFERESARTFADLTATYAASGDRIYRAVTLLTGGGGAATAYVLSKFGATSMPAMWHWLPIAVLAVWWFVLAALLMVFGMRPNNLSSGPSPHVLGTMYVSKGGAEDGSKKFANAVALQAVRWAALRGLDAAMIPYHNAISWRALWLKGVYRAAALSFIPAGLAAWLAWQLFHTGRNAVLDACSVVSGLT
jgi:hypothetical protein